MTTPPRSALLALLVLAALPPALGAAEPIDTLVGKDPELPMPKVVKVFSPRLPGLWQRSLDRPDAETRSRAAIDISHAHERGMTGLEALIPALVRELDRPGQHPAVVVAAARALVVMEAKQAAPSLLKAAAAGSSDVRELVEPALARWQYEPARAGWLARLESPPYRRGAVLAIRGLAAARDERAAPRLRDLALDRDVPAPVRLEAARALAVIRTSGSEADAGRLTGEVIDRLVAASLLHQHQGDEAVRLLHALARDPEPAVAVVALGRLVALDPKLALPVLDSALASPGGEVRALAVEVLFRLPDDEHYRLLGNLLADPHPDVRTKARRSLRELADRSGGKAAAIREGMRLIAGEDWRGQEQAAVLLAQLDHKPASGRLVALLGSPRPEVGIASAWGLRVLAVPETLPAVFRFVRELNDAIRAPRKDEYVRGYPYAAADLQLAQLIQLLGKARYREADALLRTFVPRCPLGDEARSAAAWALGHFHAGKPVPALARVMASRVAAVNPGDVESTILRAACAIALGRMKAADELDTLRTFYPSRQPSTDEVNNSCGWAIEQITGEKMPPPGIVEAPQQGWFLTPLD